MRVLLRLNKLPPKSLGSPPFIIGFKSRYQAITLESHTYRGGYKKNPTTRVFYLMRRIQNLISTKAFNYQALGDNRESLLLAHDNLVSALILFIGQTFVAG